MHVCGHRVPYASHSKLCHPHLQLAGRQHFIHNHFIDSTMVRGLQRAEFHHDGIRFRHFLIRIIPVCRGRVEIKFSRPVSIQTLEIHFPITRTYIERFFIVEFKDIITDFHGPFASDIVNTQLTPHQEHRLFQRIDRFEPKGFPYGHSSAHDHPVIHGIDHIYLVWNEYFLNQEIFSQSLRIIRLRIVGMRCITQFIICLHFVRLVLFCTQI